MPNYSDLTNTHRTKTERRAAQVNDGVDHAAYLYGASWYGALSGISKSFADLFLNNAQYFFGVSVLLSLINWAAYSVKFIFASNKNAGKLANLLHKTLNILIYVAIAIAFLAVGIGLTTTIYYASCVIDPLIHTLRAVYFTFKFLQADKNDRHAKEFFYEKTMDSVKAAVLVGLMMIAMIILFTVPGIPLAVTATVGVVCAGLALIPVFKKLYELGKKAYYAFSGKSKPEMEQNRELEDVLKLHAGSAKLKGFYKGTLPVANDNVDLLCEKIHALQRKIHNQILGDSGTIVENYLWSQRGKRESKIRALSFLDNFIVAIQVNPPESEGGELHVNCGEQKYDFQYQNKKDLIRQVDAHVRQHHPRVHQSFFKDKGRVTHCFHRAYHLSIQPSASFSPAPVR